MRTLVLAVVLALAVTACGGERPKREALPPDRAAALLHDRLWLDHPPRSSVDRFALLAFDDGDSGVLQQRTIWKGSFEQFFYEVDGGTLEFDLPGSGLHMRSTFRVERAAGPAGADHRLVIDHPPTGPRVYWGWPTEDRDVDGWLTARFGARR